MKRSILIATFTAATFFIATTPAFAQHGRPASPGAAGGVGGTHSEASTHSGSGNAGTNAGAKSPDQLLNNNSHLTTNLQKLLPTGTTPQQVCANFTNLGRCVAAIHVSHNLGIDLNSLVCDMTLRPIGTSTCPTGTATGSKGMSLGASIQALDPNADSKSASKQANQQAKQDLQPSS
jgi:hypothetical protein